MDLNSIKILNPWWENREAIDQDPHLSEILGKPFYFDNKVKGNLPITPNRSFILRGCRQVGKTTLLKEKIREAIQTNILMPEDCLYLSCEAFTSFKELQELLVQWIRSRKGHPLLICLDEITFVPEWQRALLWLSNAGLLKNATTLITGSNARDLKMMGERFPGRHVAEVKIHPVSFLEYDRIHFLRQHDRKELFEIYLKVGGFPHAIRDYYTHGQVLDETYETYANWIFTDAHQFGLTRETLLHILFRIFDTSGTQVTWQRLIEKTPIKSHETAAAYVEHLELGFLCQVLTCYDPDKEMGAPRKAKKVYYVDPLLYGVTGGFLRGIRNASVWWSHQLSDDSFKGRLFESVVVNHFSGIQPEGSLYYWYSSNLKREIDLVIQRGGELSLYEIKTQPERERPALGKPVTVVSQEDFIRLMQPA